MVNLKNLALLSVLFFGPVLAATSDGQAAPDETLAGTLQTIVDTWREVHDVPGAVLAVAFPNGETLLLTSGVANLDTRLPLRGDHAFRIGSITKTFIAAAVLQLAQEDRLSLDDSLATYLPNVPNAGSITLRHLLANRSGIPEYEDLPAFYDTVGADLMRPWTPREVIDLVARQPRDFAPGTRYAYSSSNFLLLGMVLEQVEGKPLAEVLERRFFAPLGLSHTSFMDHRRNRGELATGYSRRYAHLFAAPQVDVSTVPLTAIETVSWASGAMISSAEDLLAWARALYGGQVLDARHTQKMLTFDPAFGSYGLGVDRRDTAAGTAVGHAGSFIGFLADMRYLPATGVAVVALANVDAADVNINGVVESAIRALAGETPEAHQARLVQELQSEDVAARQRAARELGALGAVAEDAAPALIGALREDESAEVRREVALALGLAGGRHQSTIRALADALQDKDWTVRRTAAFVLGFIGPEARSAIPELELALADQQDEVRRAAAEALQQLKSD